MKKLILIRHGNTPKADRTPQRGLTKAGVRKIIESSRRIRKELDNIKSCLIISTPTNRTRQTADLLSSELGLMKQDVDDLRIHNLGNISAELDRIKMANGNLCEYYWKIDSYEQNGVESPVNFTKRVDIILSRYFEKGFDCLIVVTHEISLETIVKYSKKYVLKRKSYGDVIDYGDFAIFESKSSKHANQWPGRTS